MNYIIRVENEFGNIETVKKCNFVSDFLLFCNDLLKSNPHKSFTVKLLNSKSKLISIHRIFKSKVDKVKENEISVKEFLQTGRPRVYFS